MIFDPPTAAVFVASHSRESSQGTNGRKLKALGKRSLFPSTLGFSEFRLITKVRRLEITASSPDILVIFFSLYG